MPMTRIAFYLIIILCALSAPAPASKIQSRRPAKRALLVGTDTYRNYPKNPTQGAEEDVRETRRLLMEKYGFQDSDIKTLFREDATAQNIREAFRSWLIEGTKPGDHVFFLYSGHGIQMHDEDGDEAKRLAGDTNDEALAPYDAADNSPRSVISDDELGSYINQLSGRMAVLVFDSCFSGTVSRGSGQAGSNRPRASARYLPPMKEITGMATRSGGKGAMDDYVMLPPQANARDLNLVVDKENIKTGGIVIFSAAQPHQFAYSIPVRDDYYRGAFTYLLNRYLAQPGMSLKALKVSLNEGMAQLRRDKLLAPEQEQNPYFEVFSSVPLENEPLFGAELTTPAVALSNPVSRINLRLSTREGKKTYYFGRANGIPYNDAVSYEIETDTSGYLYLIVFSVGDPNDQDDNVATRIFPNANEMDNRVEAGRRSVFRQPLTKEGFLVTEPEGRDIVVALLSSSKLSFGQEDGYQKENYSWEDVFSLLKSRRFSEQVADATRGQSAKGQTAAAPSLDTMSWQSVSIVLEAKMMNK